MKVSNLIGQKLVSVTKPWEDDLEEGQARLVFEDGVLMVSAIDNSMLCSPSIYLEANDETT